MDVSALDECAARPEDTSKFCQPPLGCQLQVHVEGWRLGLEAIFAGEHDPALTALVVFQQPIHALRSSVEQIEIV